MEQEIKISGSNNKVEPNILNFIKIAIPISIAIFALCIFLYNDILISYFK